MGNKSHSKPETPIPIQSYIDYVTDKNKLLWEKDPLTPLLDRNLTKRASMRKISEIKPSFLSFFGFCSYKEPKFEIYEESEVFSFDFPLNLSLFFLIFWFFS